MTVETFLLKCYSGWPIDFDVSLHMLYLLFNSVHNVFCVYLTRCVVDLKMIGKGFYGK